MHTTALIVVGVLRERAGKSSSMHAQMAVLQAN
jgi:hypothetical protein